MRQDPPFDMAYITATHLLEHIHPKTLVVNDPAAVRNAPEKLLVTHFPDLMPPTMITWDLEAIRSFRLEYKDIIVKPLFGNGGAGVFRIKPDDENLAALLEMHFARSREPLMFQRYEPAVRQGDKRIILVDGEPVGVVNRVPAAGEARSNMHVGGRPEKCTLSARDREICAAIGPTLREQGMIFVGIDVIGDWLTEINVTSPTGIQEIDRFDGISIEAMIWDRIEAKRGACLIVAGVPGVLAHDGDGDQQERGDTQQIQPTSIDLRFGAPSRPTSGSTPAARTPRRRPGRSRRGCAPRTGRRTARRRETRR